MQKIEYKTSCIYGKTCHVPEWKFVEAAINKKLPWPCSNCEKNYEKKKETYNKHQNIT